MTNPITGDYEIVLGGKKYQLHYGFKAISQLIADCGAAVLEDLFKDPHPSTVAKMIVAGLQDNYPAGHPDALTFDQIVELSPPIIPSLKIVDRALSLAYWGPDGPPKAGPSEKKSETQLT